MAEQGKVEQGKKWLKTRKEELWNQTKNFPFYVYIQLGVLAFIGILVILALFQYQEDLIRTKEYDYWSYNSVSEFTNIPVKSGEIIQSFQAGYDNLDEFILLFDHYSPKDEAILYTRIVDKEGEEYYTWEGKIKNITGETYCLMGKMEKRLQKGKTYYIKIFLSEPKSDITVRAVRAKKLHESLLELTVAEETKEKTGLYFYQKYHDSYSYQTVWLWILGITVIFFVWLIYLKDKKYYYVSKGILLALLIGAGYFNIESLSGNLESISFRYVLVNWLFVAGFYLFLFAFLKKAAFYLVMIATTIIGLVNYYVLQFRGTELLISDIKSFSTAMSVAGNYEISISPEVVTCILLAICIVFLQFTADQKKIEGTIKYHLKHRAYMAAAGTVLLCFLSIVLTRWDHSGFNFFTISKNFSKYGWYYSNAFIIRYSSLQKPKGYSEKRAKEIISSIDLSSIEEENQEEIQEEIIPQNLIVIMNESLSDLKLVGELNTNKDYMPFIHSLQENTIKGNLHVSTFGGNTCITEYEFLTGNSKHFLPAGTIPYTSICEDEEEGLVKILQKQNYYAVAMHPYGASNWNRDKVYPAMGFDEFFDLEAYEDAEQIRYYVSDKADYDKIIEYYENFDKEQGLFIFNVTMQNHGGFDVNNGVVDKNILIQNIDSSIGENYLSLVYESDQAFQYLLSYFEKVEEPTMIVMFGDHLPSLSEDFYNDLYGKEQLDLEDNELERKYITPYLIWTNYHSDFEQISDISVNYLGSFVLECAGLQMPKYQQFLLNQRKTVPVIGRYGIYNENYEFVEYDDISKDLLKDYEILQYMRIKDRKSSFYNIFIEVQEEQDVNS